MMRAILAGLVVGALLVVAGSLLVAAALRGEPGDR